MNPLSERVTHKGKSGILKASCKSRLTMEGRMRFELSSAVSTMIWLALLAGFVLLTAAPRADGPVFVPLLAAIPVKATIAVLVTACSSVVLFLLGRAADRLKPHSA